MLPRRRRIIFEGGENMFRTRSATQGGLYDKLGVANFSTYLLYVRALVFGLQMLDDVEAHVLLNGRVRPCLQHAIEKRISLKCL